MEPLSLSPPPPNVCPTTTVVVKRPTDRGGIDLVHLPVLPEVPVRPRCLRKDLIRRNNQKHFFGVCRDFESRVMEQAKQQIDASKKLYLPRASPTYFQVLPCAATTQAIETLTIAGSQRWPTPPLQREQLLYIQPSCEEQYHINYGTGPALPMPNILDSPDSPDPVVPRTGEMVRGALVDVGEVTRLELQLSEARQNVAGMSSTTPRRVDVDIPEVPMSPVQPRVELTTEISDAARQLIQQMQLMRREILERRQQLLKEEQEATTQKNLLQQTQQAAHNITTQLPDWSLHEIAEMNAEYQRQGWFMKELQRMQEAAKDAGGWSCKGHGVQLQPEHHHLSEWSGRQESA